jgi:hypothetical protein
MEARHTQRAVKDMFRDVCSRRDARELSDLLKWIEAELVHFCRVAWV